MSKLSDVKEATQQTSFLSPDELMAIIEAEEQGSNGLCPIRAWCFSKRIKVSKRAMAHHRCAFEEHDQLWQCPAYNSNGHERPLDRGDVMARCAGIAYCGEKDCPHANLHRWDPMRGCHAVHCRELAAIAEGWDKETRGEPPETVVVCETLET